MIEPFPNQYDVTFWIMISLLNWLSVKIILPKTNRTEKALS